MIALHQNGHIEVEDIFSRCINGSNECDSGLNYAACVTYKQTYISFSKQIIYQHKY